MTVAEEIADMEVSALRDGFDWIAARQVAPESVRERNGVLRDLLDELLDRRAAERERGQ
jgi:hypothetical protein